MCFSLVNDNWLKWVDYLELRCFIGDVKDLTTNFLLTDIR